MARHISRSAGVLAVQPDAPHIDDQLPRFAGNEMRLACRAREEIAAHLEAREVLTAGGVATAEIPDSSRRPNRLAH